MNKYQHVENYLKKNDPILKKLIEKTGPCRLRPSSDFYGDLVREIISQQLSSKAASTIIKRFYETAGGKVEAEDISVMDDNLFYKAGISKAKTKYIKNLSSAFLSERSKFELLKKKSDKDVIEFLTAIKGIGRWTAQMFLIFSLNRLDVLPIKDIGFQNAIKKFYGLRNIPSEKYISKLSEKWAPYSSIAAWHLWKALDNK